MSDGTTILPGDDPRSVARAAALMRAGGLVGMPTETVYGLACDALNPAAVARVFEAKQRPSFDPLIVHTRDLAHARTLGDFDEAALALAGRFWPGPLTLVLPRRVDPATGGPRVPDLVTAGLDRVGLRVPAHPVAQALLAASGLALAAPSANRFGSISPTAARHVADELAGRVELVLDGGPCARGVESTVVSVGAGGVDVLRLGATTVEQIEQALPGVAVRLHRPTSDPGHAASDTALPSPGMTDRHYAPRTPLRMLDTSEKGVGSRFTQGAWTGRERDEETTPDPFLIPAGQRWGLIALGEVSRFGGGFAAARSLSPAGDLAEAAANLFAVLRELDGLGLDGIAAAAVPDTGLGRAINDRLRRASAGSLG